MKLRKFWAIGGHVLGVPPKSATVYVIIHSAKMSIF